jgi:hypothetical protein
MDPSIRPDPTPTRDAPIGDRTSEGRWQRQDRDNWIRAVLGSDKQAIKVADVSDALDLLEAARWRLTP